MARLSALSLSTAGVSIPNTGSAHRCKDASRGTLCFFLPVGRTSRSIYSLCEEPDPSYSDFEELDFGSATVGAGVAGISDVCEVEEWTGNPAQPPGDQSPLTGALMHAPRMH